MNIFLYFIQNKTKTAESKWASEKGRERERKIRYLSWLWLWLACCAYLLSWASWLRVHCTVLHLFNLSSLTFWCCSFRGHFSSKYKFYILFLLLFFLPRELKFEYDNKKILIKELWEFFRHKNLFFSYSSKRHNFNVIRLQYKGALYVYQRVCKRAMKENEEFFPRMKFHILLSRGSLNRRLSHFAFCNIKQKKKKKKMKNVYKRRRNLRRLI